MNKYAKRLARLEQKMLPPVERQFVGWLGNPWTEEEKAEAIRKEPERMFFWKSMAGEKQ